MGVSLLVAEHRRSLLILIVGYFWFFAWAILAIEEDDEGQGPRRRAALRVGHRHEPDSGLPRLALLTIMPSSTLAGC